MADEDLIDTDETTGKDALEFSDFSTEIDLVAAGPTGRGARQLWVLDAGAGVLELETKFGDRAYSGAALEEKNIPLTLGIFRIKNTTTVGRVLVFW